MFKKVPHTVQGEMDIEVVSLVPFMSSNETSCPRVQTVHLNQWALNGIQLYIKVI